MREQHIEVRRTARYYTLGTTDREPAQVWFACHGYRQLGRRFARRFQDFAADSRMVVVPEALNRFYLDGRAGPHGPESRVGATWMTREDRLADIADYVGYLDDVYRQVFEDVDRSAATVVALGFSQGAATVSRWLAYGEAEIDRLMLWAGYLPPDLDLAFAEKRLAAASPTFVTGVDDAYASAARITEEQARLREHGIPHRHVTFGGGHELDDGTLMRLAELADMTGAR